GHVVIGLAPGIDDIGQGAADGFEDLDAAVGDRGHAGLGDAPAAGAGVGDATGAVVIEEVAKAGGRSAPVHGHAGRAGHYTGLVRAPLPVELQGVVGGGRPDVDRVVAVAAVERREEWRVARRVGVVDRDRVAVGAGVDGQSGEVGLAAAVIDAIGDGRV